MRKTNIYIDSF